MRDEAIGAIPADSDNQSIIPDCSSGFRRGIVTGIDLGDPAGDSTVVIVAADESTPMTEEAWKRIAKMLWK